MRSNNTGTPKMPDGLASALIERSVPADSAITAMVVFPKPESALVPTPLGHFRSVALLQIVDGTLWLLQMPGKGWSSTRLKVVAETLSRFSGEALSPGAVEGRLRRDLGVQAVVSLEPVISTMDASQWGTGEISHALFGRDAPTRRKSLIADPGVENQIRAVESSLATELTAALEDFVDRLDPTAKKIASADGQIDVAMYNYLAQEPFRKYRQQFAQVFPGLLPAAVAADSGSIGAEVREIVDNGAPVVKELAARWQVRPGVVRYLIGRPAANYGKQWSFKMKELATLLNALRPEDLPGEGSESWSRFDRTVGIGQDIFGRPLWQFAAGLEWLKECVYRINRGTDRTEARWLPGRDTVQNIGHFRDRLAASLRRDIVAVDAETEGALNNAIDSAVSEFLCQSANKGLGYIAARIDEEFDRIRQERDQAVRVASIDAMWPLIPADYVSKDGSRAVKPLTTRSQLSSHGSKLANCLGGTFTFRYLRKGQRGTVFIVGLFEADTGIPRSTAEIAIRFGRERLNHDFVVKQHTAFENRKPSLQCIGAMEELIQYCRTPEVRKHLEKGWLLIAEAKRLHRRQVRKQIDSAVTAALQQALKEGEYDDLLASARAMATATE